MRTLRLGTRGSKLALRQAALAAQAIQKAAPGTPVEIVPITTTGDTVSGIPFSDIPEISVFTKEIEQALVAGQIDIAVHSCKDMASQLPAGLAIAAVLPRENPCDALLSHRGYMLADLPQGAKVGTSSLRRTAQLRHLRYDLQILPLRGNVETRIRKMKDEGLDAIVLACAGINRLGLTEHVTEILSAEKMTPAPGQGVIALEICGENAQIKKLLAMVHHGESSLEIQAERAFLRTFQAGCRMPVGCHASVTGKTISIVGLIATIDGQTVFKDTIRGNACDSEKLGSALAGGLIAAGGYSILKDLKLGFKRWI